MSVKISGNNTIILGNFSKVFDAVLQLISILL